MKYTIIIPAYNSAEFINIPLDSLEKQTSQDFEVLIMNDGSTDDIKDVVAPYLKRNESWKLINKRNGNWGSVINYVKNRKLASGEYVTVLDSDDYFSEDMIRSIAHRDEDIIITNINVRRNDSEKLMKVYFGKSRELTKAESFTPVSTPHGKFYKLALFQEMHELREGVSYQDTVMFNDLMSKADSAFFIDIPLATWWIDRPGNSTQVEWNLKRATLWLETCQRIITLPYANGEVNTWALMYLWELNRNYKGDIPFKVAVDTSKAKFGWLGKRVPHLAKLYFLSRTKKYRK